MMLNEKALKKAEVAFFDCDDDAPFSTPTKIRAAIEAFIAALPDAGRLVEKARDKLSSEAARNAEKYSNEWWLLCLVRELTDALVVARAKEPDEPRDFTLISLPPGTHVRFARGTVLKSHLGGEPRYCSSGTITSTNGGRNGG